MPKFQFMNLKWIGHALQEVYMESELEWQEEEFAEMQILKKKITCNAFWELKCSTWSVFLLFCLFVNL